MAKSKRGEGAGRKSEIVTVRLDPKLKYLAELAARKQRRPLSSYIEWAIEQSLANVVLREEMNQSITVGDAENLHNLWDLDEPDRVIRLALHFPELLNHDEQKIWKLVRETNWLWKRRYAGDPSEETKEGLIMWDRLRERWDKIKAVASGALPTRVLPPWTRAVPTSEDDLNG